jgi:hypothetical protein
MMTERDILDAFASMPPRREPRHAVMSRDVQPALQVQGFDLSTARTVRSSRCSATRRFS